MTTHMFVLLVLQTKVFRTSIKRFSTIFKTAVYVSTAKFCGKNFFSSVPDCEQNFSASFSWKCEKVFETASCLFRGKVWDNFFCFGKQNLFCFYFVFFPEIYRKTSWNCILSVQRPFFRGKGCLKHHKIVYVFATWSESFLDLRQTFLDKIVKIAFYVSKQTFCRKKFIHQLQNLREIFSDFGQETRLRLSFFQNCTQRVEREFDRNSLGIFFSFQQGLPTGH